MPRTLMSSSQVWAPSITVQVNAMDSRSFLDHSDDIAHAVREAILSAHTLTDVVSEL
jgi:2C-methyl-D-erythritol 2,4-cyclodiphosphate synthase